MRVIPSFETIYFLPGSEINFDWTIGSTFLHGIREQGFPLWNKTTIITEVLHQTPFCPAVCDDIDIHRSIPWIVGVDSPSPNQY